MISTHDTFTSSSGDSVVRWLRSRLGDPTAQDLSVAADSLEAETVAHLDAGGSASLGPIFERWPEARGEPALLDTVLDVAAEWFVRERGMSRDDALATLRDANPSLGAELDLCRVLGEAITASSGTPASPLVEGRLTLPAEFGPALAHGPGKRYELRQLLGRGSQGSVYLAVDRALSDPDRPAWVAVKIARVSSAAAAQRLIDEAAKVRRVEHEHVVRVLDAGVDSASRTYLVTEYVEGGTLERLRCAASDRKAVLTAVKALAGVCRGVQAIHSQGVVHCDLKPTNVLLTSAGAPRVADFGLSVRRWRVGRGPEGEIGGGNLAFMSPEQFCTPDAPPAPPGDIYALGGLLLWVLTGHGPNGTTPTEVAARLSRGDAARLETDLALITDDDLRAIARRALARTPAERYASADALAADLDRWLRHEPLAWRTPTLRRRAALFARREPVLAAVAGIAVLVVVGTGVAGGALVASSERKRAEAMTSAAAAEAKIERADWKRQVAEAEAKANESRMKSAMNSIEATRFLLSTQTNALAEMWLPVMTSLEALTGPLLLGVADEQTPNLWTDRVRVATVLIERIEKRRGGITVESGMWRTCLIYWKLRVREPEAAAALADETLTLWSARGLPDTDPLCTKVRLLRAIADYTIQPVTDGDVREAAKSTIRSLVADLKGDYQDDPLTLFALRRIGDIKDKPKAKAKEQAPSAPAAR